MKLTLHFFLLLTAALTALFPLTASAQVPGLLNYQGKVAVGPTPFTGSGQFKFALVNGSGSTTYWSHDGSSTAGSEPASAVTLSVVNGLYAVLLGDSTVAGMTRPIPASVFANSDVRLRIWFSDGTNGSQLLTPDKRIAAVAYAMVAASLDAAGMTAVQQASQTAVDAAITAAAAEVAKAKAAQKTAEDALVAQKATSDATIATLTADKQALTTQVTELTNTIGQKNEVITSLSTQVQELGDALTNAQTQFSTEKAALDKRVEDLEFFKNTQLRALSEYGTTILTFSRSIVSIVLTKDTLTGEEIGYREYSSPGAQEFDTVTKTPGIKGLQAEIRGLNEGTTITAVTAAGKTTTTTTVTGTTPPVLISVDTTNTPGTPNGTVVTTTPGVNGLTANKTQLQTQLTAANTTITGLNTQVTSLTQQLQTATDTTATLTADKQALATQVTELTNTINQKNEVITSLSTQVVELGEALTNAQNQFSYEKAGLEKQIEDHDKVISAYNDYGVTITITIDGGYRSRMTTDNRTGTQIGFVVDGAPNGAQPGTTVTKTTGIAALQAVIRGLNEGTTITAVTAAGQTTTTTVVTGTTPPVLISNVTAPAAAGTPNGTVVTTTPGINGLNAQITALQNPPAS